MSVLHDVIVQIVTERADYRTATILKAPPLIYCTYNSSRFQKVEAQAG